MNNQQDNVDRNWGFEINMAGVQPASGRSNVYVPEGYYKGKITDAYINPDKPGRVIFKVTLADGDFVGIIRTTGMNIPKSAEDKVRMFWRALAESAGYTPAQLDQGQVRLTPELFIGKDVHVRYVPKDETEDKLGDDLNFLAPAEWAQQKQAFIAGNAARGNNAARATGSANALGSGSSSPSLGSTTTASLGGGTGGTGNNMGGGTTTKGDVLSKLGLA